MSIRELTALMFFLGSILAVVIWLDSRLQAHTETTHPGVVSEREFERVLRRLESIEGSLRRLHEKI